MRKSFKTVAAVALSATMAFASYVPSMAADPAEPQEVSGTGAIFSFAVEEYVVPTSVAFALNPQGLDVIPRTGATAVTDQIIARPVGIVNKSNRAKVITVDLELATDAEGDSAITFVDSEDAVSGETDEYKIYLAVTPAAEAVTTLADGSTAIDKTTAAAALADVAITAAEDNDVVLASGSNKLAFKLDEAEYKFKTGESITLETTDNDVSDKYELDTLGGITGFTFTGAMNEDAYWENVEEQIKIDLTYDIREITDADEVIDGTGAMVPTAPDTFTVTFNANKPDGVEAAVAGLTATESVEAGGTITEQTPTLEGYTFGGWYTDAECGDEDAFAADTAINAATTLYAKWTETIVDADPAIVGDTTAFSVVPGQSIDIPISLGSGNKAATAVSEVKQGNAANSVNTLTDTKWSYADGKLTIDGSHTANISTTKYYEVYFTGSEKVVKFSISKQ